MIVTSPGLPLGLTSSSIPMTSATAPSSPSVLRTHRSGCWKVAANSWGSYLSPVDDPTANAIITDENLKKFEPANNIARIPADLWAAWIQLTFHYVTKVPSQAEVSVRILRSESDPTCFRLLVPVQEVDAASVRVESFDKAIDIITGETVTSYPPDGWTPCGSSHSHNTMAAFFSGTDDKYELGDPGLHIVVGSIDSQKMSYALTASITAGKRRFAIDHNLVVDTAPVNGVTFHPNVLTAITIGVWPLFKPVITSGKSGTEAKDQRANFHYGSISGPYSWDDGWGNDLGGNWSPYMPRQKSSYQQVSDIIDDVTNAIQYLTAAGDHDSLRDLYSELSYALADIEQHTGFDPSAAESDDLEFITPLSLGAASGTSRTPAK